MKNLARAILVSAVCFLVVFACLAPPTRTQAQSVRSDITITAVSVDRGYVTQAVVVTWSVSAPHNNYQVSEVWRSTIGPDFSTAIRVRVSKRDWWIEMDVPPAQTRWYWVRGVSQSGTYGAFADPVSSGSL